MDNEEMKDTTRVRPGSISPRMAVSVAGKWIDKDEGVLVDVFPILTYLDFGAAVEWCKSRGVEMTYDQIDPGPVFGTIDSYKGVMSPMRVDVGNKLVAWKDGTIEPWMFHEFKSRFEPIPVTHKADS